MINCDLLYFHVKRFRSLIEVKINFSKGKVISIVGENNIGKTNFLRAMNLFFNHFTEENLFDSSIDIPHHIKYGTRGANNNTQLIALIEVDGKQHTIQATFKSNGIYYVLDNKKDTKREDVENLIKNFRLFFIESNNVNLPSVISSLSETILGPLDKKRVMQSAPLNTLKTFIDEAKRAIDDIEKEINQIFDKYTDFEGNLKDKKIRIHFAEFEKLKDVVKTMTSITLEDTNKHAIKTKGSGAQRIVLLTLMEFIKQISPCKNIIWAIDEPEVFLHPTLQKKVYNILKERAKECNIILTTHSQHFLDLYDLSNVHLYENSNIEKHYKKQKNQEPRTYTANETSIKKFTSETHKALAIKENLGIENNDGWSILPLNVLVEGETDKKYLEKLLELMQLKIPNILYTGGVDKIGGWLSYYNTTVGINSNKPKFLYIVDHDKQGQEAAKKIKKSKNIETEQVLLPRYDGMLSGEKNKDIFWAIEDFIPYEIMLKTINIVLKKRGYKEIPPLDVKDRNNTANKNTDILTFAAEKSKHSNPHKEPINLEDGGFKQEICRSFCETVDKSILDQLTMPQ